MLAVFAAKDTRTAQVSMLSSALMLIAFAAFGLVTVGAALSRWQWLSMAFLVGSGLALTTAFSTSSSSATLPVTIECAEERAGISKRSALFVLPLGATINMNGTALYQGAAAVFLAQAYGVEMSLGQQFTMLMVMLLSSKGVAGVPRATSQSTGLAAR